jgi:hypothetical protein
VAISSILLRPFTCKFGVPRCWRFPYSDTGLQGFDTSNRHTRSTLYPSPSVTTWSTTAMNDVSDSPQAFAYQRDSRRSPSGLRGEAMVQKPPSRHSPIAPLAPLEYLQNQRRGSITDPSLHAAATNNMNHSHVNHHAFRQTETSGTTLPFHDSVQRISSADLHTNPSYTFGETATQQFRKLLRSPSIEGDDAHTNSLSPNNASPRSPDANSSSGSGFSSRIEGETMRICSSAFVEFIN